MKKLAMIILIAPLWSCTENPPPSAQHPKEITGRALGRSLMRDFHYKGILSPKRDSIAIQDTWRESEGCVITRDSTGITLIAYKYETLPQWELQRNEPYPEQKVAGTILEDEEAWGWFISRVTKYDSTSSVGLDTILTRPSINGGKRLMFLYKIKRWPSAPYERENLEQAQLLLEKLRRGGIPTALEMYGASKACQGYSWKQAMQEKFWKEGL